MTWIVANTLFAGYSALISDVQVTWSSSKGKHREDCLRKVYAIAPNIACGFSGSVETGFRLLADMHLFANALRANGKELLPREFAYQWHRRGRKIFSSFSKSQRKLGCSLIMATFSPSENGANAQNVRTDIIILRHSNGFQPVIQPHGKAISIGSGSSIEKYLAFLNDMNKPENRIAIDNSDRFSNRGAMTMALLSSVMLKDNVQQGISHHMHCTIVNENGVQSFPLDYEQSIGEAGYQITMPKVAESYSAFKTFEQSNIFNPSSAIA